MEFLSYIREHGHLPLQMLKQLCESVRGGCFWVIEQVKEILIEENTVQPVSSPVNVRSCVYFDVQICGDIHGQYSDLLELFRTGGEVPDKSYIFMVMAVRLKRTQGDYVDRGYAGCEVFQLLMALKLWYESLICLDVQLP